MCSGIYVCVHKTGDRRAAAAAVAVAVVVAHSVLFCLFCLSPLALSLSASLTHTLFRHPSAPSALVCKCVPIPLAC